MAFGLSLSRYLYFTAQDGLRLAYRVGGPRDGKPILLLHGMASRGDTWDRVATLLIRKGRRVVVPDMRGHGRSGRATRYPLETFGTDAIQLLDELQLEQVDLIGHSLGGHTALSLAQRHPHRVRRLPEWWAGMEHVDAPVLLLGGTRSHVPPSRLALLAARLPRAKLEVLDGGHRLHTEEREAFLAAALPFLAD